MSLGISRQFLRFFLILYLSLLRSFSQGQPASAYRRLSMPIFLLSTAYAVILRLGKLTPHGTWPSDALLGNWPTAETAALATIYWLFT